MSEVRPVHERELLIDDDVRAAYRLQLDPLITDALESRGYTESRSPVGRIALDSFPVLPSTAFLSTFDKARFDGLAVGTTHSVNGDSKQLVSSELILSSIGGFNNSKFITNGNRFYTQNLRPVEQSGTTATNQLPKEMAIEIMQDIRAHTELGYSSADVFVPADIVIEELEALHNSRNIDRRAHYQLLTSEEHGDIRMDIGESFELQDVVSRMKTKQRILQSKKLFKLVARQPLDNGSSTVGVTYRSGQNTSEVKITAIIEGTNYTDAEKQAMYLDMINSFQDQNVHKFAQGVMRNLKNIADPDSEVVRLG
jgi:hypothetical protein